MHTDLGVKISLIIVIITFLILLLRHKDTMRYAKNYYQQILTDDNFLITSSEIASPIKYYLLGYFRACE